MMIICISFTQLIILDCCILGCVCNTLFRDIIAEHMMDTSQGYMIGGPGCTVEVDESLFGWLIHNIISYLNCVASRKTQV